MRGFRLKAEILSAVIRYQYLVKNLHVEFIHNQSPFCGEMYDNVL